MHNSYPTLNNLSCHGNISQNTVQTSQHIGTRGPQRTHFIFKPLAVSVMAAICGALTACIQPSPSATDRQDTYERPQPLLKMADESMNRAVVDL